VSTKNRPIVKVDKEYVELLKIKEKDYQKKVLYWEGIGAIIKEYDSYAEVRAEDGSMLGIVSRIPITQF